MQLLKNLFGKRTELVLAPNLFSTGASLNGTLICEKYKFQIKLLQAFSLRKDDSDWQEMEKDGKLVSFKETEIMSTPKRGASLPKK